MSPAELKRRAGRLARALRRVLPEGSARVSLTDGASRVGGGSFPERDLPTTLVRVQSPLCAAETLRVRLLSADPPLVGRVERDAFLLDPRTLEEQEFGEAARIMARALAPADSVA